MPGSRARSLRTARIDLQRLPGRRPGRGGLVLPGRRSFLPASARRKRALRGDPDGVTLVLTVISFSLTSTRCLSRILN